MVQGAPSAVLSLSGALVSLGRLPQDQVSPSLNPAYLAAGKSDSRKALSSCHGQVSTADFFVVESDSCHTRNSEAILSYLRVGGVSCAPDSRGDMHTSSKESVQTASSPQTRHAGNRSGAGSFVAAAILAAFYFATSIYIASHRVFWFDELFTIHIARLPDRKSTRLNSSH